MVSPESDGTYTITSPTFAVVDTTLSKLAITVTASGSSGGSTLTVEDNFVAPSASYFADAGITVTPSADDLSFTVACEKACVVAIQKADGTYELLTGDANHKFTAQSAEDKIVVAVKGDVSGDGVLSAAEAAQVKAAQLGLITDFTPLQMLVSDLNGDNTLSAAEAAQIKAAQLGSLSLAW